MAATRARERLYLSYCIRRTRAERTEPRRLSRFFRDLPADLMTRVPEESETRKEEAA